MNLDATLLEILACPACHAALRADDANSELACTGCGLIYPVRDDIPVMLLDEARRPDAARDHDAADRTVDSGGGEPREQ